MIESVGDGIVYLDGFGKILAVNKVIENMTGFSKDAVDLNVAAPWKLDGPSPRKPPGPDLTPPVPVQEIVVVDWILPVEIAAGSNVPCVVSQNNVNQVGFYNENDLSKFARLDISTGKWTASGGVTTMVGGREVDLGEEVMALRMELAAVRSELATLKGH